MALEPCAWPREWKRSSALTSRLQVTQFPHAVLEVKLMIEQGATLPEWVVALLDSGLLREVPKFSKFVHGTALLNLDSMAMLPYWWAPEYLQLWADADQLRPLAKPKRKLERRNGEKRAAAAGVASPPPAVLKEAEGVAKARVASTSAAAELARHDWQRALLKGFEWLVTCGSPQPPPAQLVPAGSGRTRFAGVLPAMPGWESQLSSSAAGMHNSYVSLAGEVHRGPLDV